MASREPLQDTSVVDDLLLTHEPSSADYLKECKLRSRKKLHHGQRRDEVSPEPMEVDDDDDDNSCLVWEEKHKQGEKRKFKLLQFHRNYRPAYYGTWTKTSGSINPRNPFKMDTVSVCDGSDCYAWELGWEGFGL